MKLTKAEKIALTEFLNEFEDSFCKTRAGKTEEDNNAYLCPKCPFHLKSGICNLRVWRNNNK